MNIASDSLLLDGEIDLHGSDGGRGGSITLLVTRFSGAGYITMNGSSIPAHLDDTHAPPGLPGNIFLNISASNNFTGHYFN